MKRFLCFILILSVGFAFVGCNEDKKPFRFSYDIKSEPKNLDPQTATDAASLLIISNVFEGLLLMESDGTLQPGIAKSYQISSDNLTYTFELRENIKWNYVNDNAEDVFVTADDFVFAFQRLLNPQTNSKHARLYHCIKNAQAVNEGKAPVEMLGVVSKGKNIVEFTLEYENPNFLNLLTKTCAMPCNEAFFIETKGRYGLEPYTIMANGPFILTKWTHNENMRLEHNQYYYDEKNVAPTSISLWIQTKTKDQQKEEKESGIIKDNTVDRLLGEKTIAGMVNGFEYDKITKKGFDTEAMESSTWGIAFNFQNEQLSNKNIRLAIATAFDRNSYEAVLPNSLSLATAIVPNNIVVSGQNYREFAGKNLVQPYNAEKANEYFTNGLTELQQDKVTGTRILVPKNENVAFKEHFLFTSQVLQRDLGVFIGIDEVSEEEYQSKLKKGDFDCVIVNLNAVENSPKAILNQFHTGSDLNYYGYSNTLVDHNLDKTAELNDYNEILKLYQQVEQQLIDDVAFIPMYYKTDYFVTNQSVKNFKYNKQTGIIVFKDVKKN